MQENFYPLPSEMPRAANLDEVPHYIKISKTVESLIGQNEDLMARLKVNIRQNTLLESQLRDQEQTNRQIKALNSKINSQVEILIEKESLLREKLDSQDVELEQTREFLNQNKITEHEVSILRAYQRRIRAWVRGFISKLQYQMKMLKQKNQELENDVIEQQKKLTDFKVKINEAQRTLQIKEREHQKDKVQLIEDFENRTYNLNHENQSLTHENKNLKAKVGPFLELQKQLNHAHISSQNFARKYDESLIQSEKQIADLNKQLHTYMTQTELSRVQNDSTQKRNAEFESQNRILTAKNHEAMSRHEAMNVLWSETQLQRAQLKLKNDAMIRLNRDLSLILKEQNRMLARAEIMNVEERDAQIQNIREIETLMSEIETSILSQNEI